MQMPVAGPADPSGLRLRPWSEADLPLLREVNAPSMTAHLGGPETEQQVLDRHRRYLDAAVDGTADMFVIVAGTQAVPVGTIGYWERRWHDEDVYETGWHVLPAFQGRGHATTAARLIVEHAREHGRRSALHAYPSADHPASNAVCRKAGFRLLGRSDFEYPRGRLMRVNDWRLDLRTVTGR